MWISRPAHGWQCGILCCMSDFCLQTRHPGTLLYIVFIIKYMENTFNILIELKHTKQNHYIQPFVPEKSTIYAHRLLPLIMKSSSLSSLLGGFVNKGCR